MTNPRNLHFFTDSWQIMVQTNFAYSLFSVGEAEPGGMRAHTLSHQGRPYFQLLPIMHEYVMLLSLCVILYGSHNHV